MYKEIQRLAYDALALQYKADMAAALRKISALCGHAGEQQPAPALNPFASDAANRMAEVAGVVNRKPVQKGASQ